MRSGFSLKVIMKSDENLIFYGDIPQRIVLTLIENKGFPRQGLLAALMPGHLP